MSIDEIVSAILQAPHDKWTTRDDIKKKYGVEAKDAVEALKRLESKGVGRYVVGRGSFPTRLEWGTPKSMENNEQASSSRWQQPAYIDYQYPLDNDRYGTLRIPKDISREEAEDFAGFASSILSSFARKKTEG
jgi:hypothetical protein